MGEQPAPQDDTLCEESGKISGTVLRPHEETSEPAPIEIQKHAYMNGCTWLLCNWFKSNDAQQEK